ncbi:hypothetical protein BDK51DRAFT_28715 [Blyttiomyces helicus]|uniref:Uncharacterized protein n=1 Tax=Blyttiomyces helicus TaxID=388810 RepID=A0A4P9WKM0_9FUNG|nr:hypothetical protein BDK51DRAFT_28715 [Blyttiomyces helicus]|eukprot:RKO92563.1 hypothetical protein BDK51DRAFT_28715 [Blyttiomyces helicus]
MSESDYRGPPTPRTASMIVHVPPRDRAPPPRNETGASLFAHYPASEVGSRHESLLSEDGHARCGGVHAGGPILTGGTGVVAEPEHHEHEEEEEKEQKKGEGEGKVGGKAGGQHPALAPIKTAGFDGVVKGGSPRSASLAVLYDPAEFGSASSTA